MFPIIAQQATGIEFVTIAEVGYCAYDDDKKIRIVNCEDKSENYEIDLGSLKDAGARTRLRFSSDCKFVALAFTKEIRIYNTELIKAKEKEDEQCYVINDHGDSISIFLKDLLSFP